MPDHPRFDRASVHVASNVPAAAAERLCAVLHEAGIDAWPSGGAAGAPDRVASNDPYGVVLFAAADDALRDLLDGLSGHTGRRLLGVVCDAGYGGGPSDPPPDGGWTLPGGGLADVVRWSGDDGLGAQVAARLARWRRVDAAMASPSPAGALVGGAPAFRTVLGEAVEAALFTDAAVLVTGESGTGKELVARLVDRLDPRTGARGPVVVDCTNVVPELSGSEFFGHERGAFTGAVGQREGAFALADGGTLFLDEVGELPPVLQAQLLRVIQEGTYKRVGGNAWHRTRFRLVCATNRDLAAMVRAGGFRADLYHRLAGVTLHLPPLRERIEDVLPLARHFAAEHAAGAGDAPGADGGPAFDRAVERWLQSRDYPGNVRELRQVVARLMQRWVGVGPVTVGCIPQQDRAAAPGAAEAGGGATLKAGVRRALADGAGLKDVGRLAEDAAFRIALEESGSLRDAARRLGVTDRALQLRRKAAASRP